MESSPHFSLPSDNANLHEKGPQEEGLSFSPSFRSSKISDPGLFSLPSWVRPLSSGHGAADATRGGVEGGWFRREWEWLERASFFRRGFLPARFDPDKTIISGFQTWHTDPSTNPSSFCATRANFCRGALPTALSKSPVPRILLSKARCKFKDFQGPSEDPGNLSVQFPPALR